MLGWGVDRWLAVAGLLVATCACVLAYYFYRKTVLSKLLAIAYTVPVPIIVSDPSSQISESTSLNRNFVLLWNKGTSPITESDFTKPIVIENSANVRGAFIFEQDVASAVEIDQKSKDIRVKLLRPNEAAIVEIVEVTGSSLALAIQMVSADMSVSYQRKRRISEGFITLVQLLLAIAIPLATLSSLAHIEPPLLFLTLALAGVAFVASGFIMVKGEAWGERLNRAITPPVVWNFLLLKDAALRAQAGASILRAAYTWFRRGTATL
jgi:hypothetical protein